MSTSRRPNIPTPWPKAISVAGKNIANLASAVGGVISGPTSTINPQLHGSRYDEARRLERRNQVSPERSRRLASMSQGNPEMATLSPGTRYPSARQKEMERPLYTQFLEQRAKGPVLWAIIWDLLGLGEGSAMRGR